MNRRKSRTAALRRVNTSAPTCNVSYTAEYGEDVTDAAEGERSAEIDYKLYGDFHIVGSTFEKDDGQRYGPGLRLFFRN